MEVHPATRQAEADRAPHGDARESRALSGALEVMLLALLGLLCRHLGLTMAAPATGWTAPLLLHALATLIPTRHPRRRRTPELRPFIPRRLRRGSPELMDVDFFWLPPRGPARPRRRRSPPLRPRQGRGPPACARIHQTSAHPAPWPQSQGRRLTPMPHPRNAAAGPGVRAIHRMG